MLSAIGLMRNQETFAARRGERRLAQASERVIVSDQSGKVTMQPLERGGRVAISNRNGHIIISGWDRDAVEATATSARGAEVVQAAVSQDPAGNRVTLSTLTRKQRSEPDLRFSDTQLPKPSQASPRPSPPVAPQPAPEPMPKPTPKPGVRRTSDALEINLEVKLPRYAEVESIETETGGIKISGIDGPISAVRTNDGDVRIQDVGAFVNVVIKNGNIALQNIRGDVRALSLLGTISVECAQARVEASNTRGAITLANIGGDMDINSTDGDIEASSSIRAGGRYQFRTVLGRIRMMVEPNAPGFTATLSSYRGKIDDNFPLTLKSPPENTRRVIGRYGDGQAQITLDSFHGDITLGKALTGSTRDCGREGR